MRLGISFFLYANARTAIRLLLYASVAMLVVSVLWLVVGFDQKNTAPSPEEASPVIGGIYLRNVGVSAMRKHKTSVAMKVIDVDEKRVYFRMSRFQVVGHDGGNYHATLDSHWYMDYLRTDNPLRDTKRVGLSEITGQDIRQVQTRKAFLRTLVDYPP